MELTKSFEIPRINLNFDYNNFIIAEIVYGLTKIRKIFVIFFNFITVVGK